jgi:vitamin B12 transporter
LIFNVSQNNVLNNYTELPSAIFNNSTLQIIKNQGKITNLEAVLNYKLNEHFDLTSGAGIKYSKTGQYGLYDNPPASIINPDTAHSTISSIYSSLFYKAGIFHIELGGRFNHHNKYGNNFTYTFNPSLYIFKQFKLFTTLASAYKSPSLYQLFSNFGNTNLKPETTTSYEAGFNWDILNSILSFNTVLYKNITNQVIYFYTNPSTYASIYKNGQQQNDKGFESDLKLNVKKLSVSAYIAYVTGMLTDENGIKTNNLLRRPSHTYGLNASYQLFNNFSLGVNYKYTGDRTEKKYYPDYSSSIISLKPYSLFDAEAQYSAHKHLTLFADFKNIFNQKYTDWLGYNTRGFNFMAGIKYAIN